MDLKIHKVGPRSYSKIYYKDCPIEHVQNLSSRSNTLDMDLIFRTHTVNVEKTPTAVSVSFLHPFIKMACSNRQVKLYWEHPLFPQHVTFIPCKQHS